MEAGMAAPSNGHEQVFWVFQVQVWVGLFQAAALV